LAVPLPEEIEREKACGDFVAAEALIARYLSEHPSHSLRKRLELERGILRLLASEYGIAEEEAIAQIRSCIADFTPAEFEELRLRGEIDWMYLANKRMYYNQFCASLLKMNAKLAARAKGCDQKDYAFLESVLETMRKKQYATAHMHIRQTFTPVKESIRPGERLRVHMPLPILSPTVSDLNILSVSPNATHVAAADYPQRTVCFETIAAPGQVFTVEYALNKTARYVDLSAMSHEANTGAPVKEPPGDRAEFLAEQFPQIRFTPFLRMLAAEIAGEEANPLRIARRFYDFITENIVYAFTREYASIEHIAEYCALRRRGDCGAQSWLFIILCRIAGIPARWQSGIGAEPEDVGDHDWAQFYVEPYGWLDADCAYGGIAYQKGASARQEFYFGNTDPFRIVFNDAFQHDFDPPKAFMRADPYDNQCGEAEYEDRGFRLDEFICAREAVDIHLTE
jgi:hypothetical protein